MQLSFLLFFLAGEALLTQLFFLWTTHSLTFKYRNLAVLESFMHFHPEFEVKIYSSYSLSDVIKAEQYRKRGYKLEIVLLDKNVYEHFSTACPNGHWLKRENIKSSKYYYSHLTDYLRFCILYLNGGIYADFDALLVNRIPGVYLEFTGIVAGLDLIPKGETCGWCLGSNKEYYIAPGLLLAGRPLTKILKNALLIGFSDNFYNPYIFNAAGPFAINLAFRLEENKNQIKLLERHLFYPRNYQEIKDAFKKVAFSLYDYNLITKSSISFHFFGGTTKELLIEDGSLLSKLFPPPILPKSMSVKIENFFDFSLAGNLIKNAVIRFEGDQTLGIFDGNLHYKVFGDQKTVNEFILKIKVLNNSGPFCLQFQTHKYCVPKINVNNLLTIIVKPFGRIAKVISLIQSIRNIYPNINILVGNDGLPFLPNMPSRNRIQVLDLPFDIGLSSGRNLLIEKYLETDFFFIIDEDFTFAEPISDISQLFFDFEKYNLDILASICLNDELDYVGNFFLSIKGSKRRLWMLPVIRNYSSEIQLAEFVPNVFLARKKLILKLQWRDILKLGEHEDYFFSAKKKED